MTLYELNEQIKNFEFEVDEETGEITNIADLDEIKLNFNEKAENIIKYIKNLTAEMEALKTEEKALEGRRKIKENKIERLKEYLAFSMMENNIQKLEFTSGVANFRTSEAVEVDEQFIKWAETNGDQYLSYKEPAANKTEIKKAIKDGLEIPYARIITNKRLGVK